MSAHTILNSKTHRNVHVVNARGAQYGENINTVAVIADELPFLSCEYPVCFLKHPESGEYGLHALTGLDEGENLFLQTDQWHATYIPLHVLRQPFMIALQDSKDTQATTENTVLTIDLQHPRVSNEGGEALFDKNGQATEFLNAKTEILATLVDGLARTQRFTEALLAQDLLEPRQLNITLKNDEQKRFQGFYSINEEKLSLLSGDVLDSFHKNGYLEACYLMLASFGNVQKLINLKNK